MNKENHGRKITGMLAGNVILALGIAVFRFLLTGNDAYTAMNIAISMKNKARNPGNSLPGGIAFLFSCR